MTETALIRNCRRYDAPEGDAPTDVLIRDGRIHSYDPADPPDGIATLDAAGRVLIPGLVDLHIHGAGGGDVLDGSADSLRVMAQALAPLGTTAFVATTYLHPAEGTRHLGAVAEQTGRDLGGARLLGLYLEGPFINPDKRGGIPTTAIHPFGAKLLDEVLDRCAGTLRLMTVAPELPGAAAVVARLLDEGVIPSFGHSAATYEQTREGVAAGMRHATHLFNAMAGIHHRDPGPIPALLEADQVVVELISDDAHVRAPVARLAARAFGERCLLITDGMRTVGLPEGRYQYGGREFESRGGAARYLDGTLIGTSIPLLEIVRRFQRFTGCPLAQAVDAATRLPARVLGLAERLGTLSPGADADLVLLDPDLSVWATLVGGKVVYRK